MFEFTEAQIRDFIPNITKAAPGETPLSDRLARFIDSAKDTFLERICPEEFLIESLIPLAREAVIWRAWAEAVGSLDLVLTPNGFAVVSNQNLAPASKERVAAARVNAKRHAAAVEARCIRKLWLIEGWNRSRQANNFISVFGSPDVLAHWFPGSEDFMADWFRMQWRILEVEQDLANNHFSLKFYRGLLRLASGRMEQDNQDIAVWRKALNLIRDIVARAIEKGMGMDVRALFNLKSWLCGFPDSEPFKLWEDSAAYRAFKTGRYENTENSSGFFF